MKPKMRRKDLIQNEGIWNAVISVISEYDFPTEDEMANEAFIVFHYYSELESGGHESLFTWFSEYIKEVGINYYLQKIIAILEKIDAHDYAALEKKYGENMWRLFIALENDEMKENEFYHAIEKADNEYTELNNKLEALIETYFVSIHAHLIEIIEE